jgi:hypothetical protein
VNSEHIANKWDGILLHLGAVLVNNGMNQASADSYTPF